MNSAHLAHLAGYLRSIQIILTLLNIEAEKSMKIVRHKSSKTIETNEKQSWQVKYH